MFPILLDCTCYKPGSFGIEGCISSLPEKRNGKDKNMHSIKANFNLGQDVAIKSERK